MVQPGGRLVENQHARPQHQHARDRQALALALAEQERIALALVLKADGFERLVASTLNFISRQTEIARTERDFVFHRRGENLMVGILENVRDFARRLRRTHLRAILAVDRHAARRWLEQPDDVLRQSRFAGTVLPDDREKFSRADFEINRIEHARTARVAVTQVFDSDKCGADDRIVRAPAAVRARATGRYCRRWFATTLGYARTITS